MSCVLDEFQLSWKEFQGGGGGGVESGLPKIIEGGVIWKYNRFFDHSPSQGGGAKPLSGGLNCPLCTSPHKNLTIATISLTPTHYSPVFHSTESVYHLIQDFVPDPSLYTQGQC